jgi:anti-sigma factor RsiW
MMACREILDFLMEYLDGNLSPAQRAIFEEHLAVCPDCVAYLHNYRRTVKLVKSLADTPSATDAPEDFVKSVLAARP